MNKKSVFLSDRLSFRGINETDTECLVRWRSNPGVIQYFRHTIPLTKEAHIHWYKNTYSRSFRRFDFVVTEKATEKAIGTVGVNSVDYEKSSCEISYMIAEPDCQHKGYAVEAIRALMDEMVKEGICRFFAEIHSENIASRRTIEKLKFTCCGEHLPFVTYVKMEEINDS